VRVLHEQTAGDRSQVPTVGRGRRCLDDARVLPLGQQRVDGAIGVGRSDDDVGLGGGDHLLDRGVVDRSRQGHDPAERRPRVALEGEPVRVGEVLGDGRTAGVGVLDDGDGGLAGQLVEVVGEQPGGVGVVQVEVRQRQAAVEGEVGPPRVGALGAVQRRAWCGFSP
jgi:hypothetical protein